MSQEVTTQESNKSLSTLTANDVPALLEKVNSQIKSLKGNAPEITRVTKALPGFGKIDEINDVQSLVKAYSAVSQRKNIYDETIKNELPDTIKYPSFTIEGCSAKQWQDTIKDRLSTVANKVALDKLNRIKKTLEENLSAEAKLANDLAKIEGMLDE